MTNEVTTEPCQPFHLKLYLKINLSFFHKPVPMYTLSFFLPLLQIPKLLLHRMVPNARYSIWVDGKLELVVDPYQILERFVLVFNVA